MFSKKWATSPRRYEVVRDREVKVPVGAGFTLDCDVFRPDSTEKFPAILCAFPFHKEPMFEPMMPRAIAPVIVAIEGGDPNFYARRGYAQIFLNVRGTGKSGGTFDHLGDGTTQDLYDAIEWIARQAWCDGQVATFGTSYFAMTDKRVAELKPLPGVWPPHAIADLRRTLMPHWHRVVELWYETFDDWRRAVISAPPSYTKPAWAHTAIRSWRSARSSFLRSCWSGRTTNSGATRVATARRIFPQSAVASAPSAISAATFRATAGWSILPEPNTGSASTTITIEGTPSSEAPRLRAKARTELRLACR
jgi:hypothetical protein